MNTATIAGEYYLQGQREMASGFLFQPSGEFQFFFSYGALDRQGKGSWAIAGDKLILNSGPRPASDFSLVRSGKTNEPFVIIQIEKVNPVLLHHVFCSLEKGREGTWDQMSQEGKLQFPLQEIASISLLLEFCPERYSTIPIDNKDHNEFLFRMEPTIMEVFFEDFELKAGGETLMGRHPLLEGDNYVYVKTNDQER